MNRDMKYARRLHPEVDVERAVTMIERDPRRFNAYLGATVVLTLAALMLGLPPTIVGIVCPGVSGAAGALIQPRLMLVRGDSGLLLFASRHWRTAPTELVAPVDAHEIHLQRRGLLCNRWRIGERTAYVARQQRRAFDAIVTAPAPIA